MRQPLRAASFGSVGITAVGQNTPCQTVVSPCESLSKAKGNPVWRNDGCANNVTTNCQLDINSAT
jgi:hypothetical protein